MVEDEPAISDVCQRVLTGEGFEVDIAVNGKVAQDMINKKQYDLCLLDIRMPEINGVELFQWLKDRHLEMAKGVIFTSGDVVGSDTQSFLEQTGRPFLPKPFTPDELKAIIRKTVEEGEK